VLDTQGWTGSLSLMSLKNLINEESLYFKNLTKLLIDQTYKSFNERENRSYDVYNTMEHKYGYDQYDDIDVNGFYSSKSPNLQIAPDVARNEEMHYLY